MYEPFLVKSIGNSLELTCSITVLFLVTVHVGQKVFVVMIDSYTQSHHALCCQLSHKLRNLEGFIFLPTGAILLFLGENGDLKVT